MDQKQKNSLEKLERFYDKLLHANDPVTHAYRIQELLLATAEHLLEPLQEDKLAEMCKLNHRAFPDNPDKLHGFMQMAQDSDENDAEFD